MAAVSAVALLLVVSSPVSAGVITAFATGFEVGDGYSVGALSGQDSWQGDVEGSHITVDDGPAKTGTQALMLNGRGSGAQVEDYRAVGSVTGEFTWEFSVIGNGIYNGSDNFIRLSDTGNDAYAAYLFFDGRGYSGVKINYVDATGMHELLTFADSLWHDIKIVGSTLTDTFDFHFDGSLEASARPFFHDVDDIANLSVGSDTYSGGAYQIAVDDVRLTYVPTPSTSLLMVPGLIHLMRLGRRRKASH